ncbi:ARID DNA-binding domain-containing protein [Tanacetum coccineum]
MVNTNTFLEERWSRPSSSACGLPNIWYQSKSLGRPPRKRLHYGFIQRQLKREKEARLGNCIRQITHDCKDMLRRKLEEIELYNSTISQSRNRKQKCYKCRQRGHIIKSCPEKEKVHDEGTKKPGNTSILMKGQESAKLVNKELMTTKPTVSLKYPEYIHFSTKCMVKGTDQGHWDDIWYISSNTNMHLCSKLNLFCNIKENFAVSKLDDQMKFLFTYGIGEVVVKNGDQGYLIPGVHYAPEVTLNVLSIELLERQGIEIIYEDNTCRLIYMFCNPKDHKLNEDKLRTMQNEYLEKYFESLEKGDNTGEGMKTVGMISMEADLIEIKGAIYSTRIVEEGKEYTCLTSHQHIAEIKAPSMEATSGKGKEKVENFGVKLEDVKREPHNHHFQPIQSNIKGNLTLNKNFQGLIKRPTNSEPADKEDINSNSSDDFTIIT